ncbi:MAG: DUF2807 domain-containing protein [Myxococcales bacterium]|nr:DUF2807 domain-containing protein [Myxococcales bacterium]
MSPRHLPLPLLVALLLLGCGGVAGSGVSKTEARTVPPFTKLAVGGDFQFEVTHGAEQKVELTADDNILPLLRTEVSGGTLTVEPKESIKPKVRPTLRLVVTQPLAGLSASGSVEGSVRGITGEAFTLGMSGSGAVTLAGQTKTLTLKVSGSGTVRAADLAADSVTVGISGAGDAQVHAQRVLDVSVSGAGKVRYRGDPNITKAISGAGSVDKL